MTRVSPAARPSLSAPCKPEPRPACWEEARRGLGARDDSQPLPSAVWAAFSQVAGPSPTRGSQEPRGRPTGARSSPPLPPPTPSAPAPALAAAWAWTGHPPPWGGPQSRGQALRREQSRGPQSLAEVGVSSSPWGIRQALPSESAAAGHGRPGGDANGSEEGLGGWERPAWPAQRQASAPGQRCEDRAGRPQRGAGSRHPTPGGAAGQRAAGCAWVAARRGGGRKLASWSFLSLTDRPTDGQTAGKRQAGGRSCSGESRAGGGGRRRPVAPGRWEPPGGGRASPGGRWVPASGWAAGAALADVPRARGRATGAAQRGGRRSPSSCREPLGAPHFCTAAVPPTSVPAALGALTTTPPHTHHGRGTLAAGEGDCPPRGDGPPPPCPSPAPSVSPPCAVAQGLGEAISCDG